MIELRDRQILIDGEPRLILSGEIHYFRLDRSDWQDRIDKLKAAGCNTVASYIPWLCHERLDGSSDLTGWTEPHLDLAGFVDLCRNNGLWFFARPGPFVMAELKNEGLPFRLYEEHPEIVPVGWDGAAAPSRTVDYLAPAFLEECRRWYEAVGAVLGPRLQPNGGNVISIQLDNEIGMLSWVTNSPDLTDHVLEDFWEWLERRYAEPELSRRYPPDRFGPASRAAAIRSPSEAHALPLLRDLGHYMRDRCARYVAALRGYAEAAGMGGVPFVVNVHGTAGGRALPYPIGISQLYEAYTQAEGYVAGSDHYLGELTARNLPDLYLLNAFHEAVNRPEQPLTSVEFECGDGNYGEHLDVRYDPAAADFKLRISLAQGNRLINFYLMAGGANPRLEGQVGDGNDRIGFTGERHGFAAPIGPEGHLNSTYPRLACSVRSLGALSDKLAVAREEHDGVALGFIPDYFMTECVYPASAEMKHLVDNLTANRFGGPNENLARAMLLAGFRFGAVDVQNRPLDPATTPVLALASARFMDGALQDKLVAYLERGGRLLLVGNVPQADMEGRPSTALLDALALRPAGERQASPRYHLSVVADGWAAPRPELRVGRAHVFDPVTGSVLFRVYGKNEACAFDRAVGEGRAIVVTADLPCDVDFFCRALGRLGVTPRLAHNCPDLGIFLTSTATPAGERFVHLLNLDGFAKRVRLTDGGQSLLTGGDLILRPRDGLMLPFGVSLGPARIIRSTAEAADVGPDTITFRVTQPAERIELETDRPIVPSDDYVVESCDGRMVVISRGFDGWEDEARLTVGFG